MTNNEETRTLHPETIIVTGAAGFIGSCMVRYLNKHGYENLILVDKFIKDEKLKNWKHKKYRYEVDRDLLFEWLERNNLSVDFVIHLGARTDTTEFDYTIHEVLNLEYSQDVWNYCTANNIPLIYASSAATYGAGELGYEDDHDVIKDLKVYGELHRYIPVLAHWQGFKITEMPVQHHPRKYGKTKFGTGRFWKGFLDLLTVLFTTRYFRRPLHLFGFWGLVFFVAGFLIDAYLVFLKFSEGMALSNRPLFVGGVLLIIVGVQFVSIGLLGELIFKTRHTSVDEYSIREVWK